MQCDFPALGTHWWIEVWDDLGERTTSEITDFARCFVSDFEQKYSRFLPESEISILNRDRVLPDPTRETRALLGCSIDLYRRTRGVFNVMVGHILEARGYDAAYSLIDRGSADLQPGNPLTDLIISADAIKLRYGNIDIGGYGKGWVIDRLAEQLHDRFGVEQFLINGGGDIYVTHQNNQPVEIFLEDPLKPGTVVGSTKIKNRAFAASSPHKRSWPTEHGTKQHHIVTAGTTEDVVYLTASNTVDADAFATTLLQVDQESARDLVAVNELILI